MSVLGKVYSVLIGPGLGVGSSSDSILIFFFGTGDGSSDETLERISTELTVWSFRLVG